MTEDHDDFAFEPIPGLPETLPEGESLLWQGSPDWRALARSAFHVNKVAAYFGVVLVWQAMSASADGATASAMAVSALRLLAVGAAAIAILGLLARLYARGTIYTLTSRRIVIRSGLALPVTLNLPLALVETVAVTRGKGGNGNVALTVTKPNRIAYLALWPNARPFRLADPQPMLRCLADADAVAARVAKALRAEAGEATGEAMTETRTRTPGRSAAGTSSEPAGMPAGRTLAA